jgi:YD repeat-containing protein
MSTDILDGLHIGLYKTYVNKFNFTSQLIKEYKTPVPISDLNNSDTYEHFTSQKLFEYTTYVGLPSKTIANISKSHQVIENNNLYPDDILLNSDLGYDILTDSELSAIKKMQKPTSNNPTGLHKINSPIQVETIIKDIQNNVLSKSIQRTNYSEPFTNIILPKTIQTSKGENDLEDRIIYHHYDNRGNPLEVSKANGTHIVYIWGYNQTQPIAKVENATYAEVEAALQAYSTSISAIQIASNEDDDNCNELNCKERQLRNELKKLKDALPNSQVITYTYDPLIGVTSITDPRGETIYYYYDGFNRLEYVKDAQGNILSKNEYHYKNQE